jgi:hypothetical protein
MLALGAAVTGATGVRAQSAQSASPPPPSPQASVNAGQVATPNSSSVDTDQISPTRAASVGQTQVNGSGRTADAPAGPSSVSQGRNAAVAPIKGRDHCDPAAGSTTAKPECAQILDQRADSFNGAPAPQPAPVDTSARTDSSSLVDSIVNGGTGTVVTLPPPTPK